jgi:uncharacterized membrane protein YphA (DoxX/SURF4 family)
MAYLALTCRCLIGLVFAVSAFSKLRSRPAFSEFAAWLNSLPVPLARGHGMRGKAAHVIAAAEVAIVVLTAMPWTVRAGLALAAVVLAGFTAGTWLAVARGGSAPCRCFGASATPLSRRHVVRNALLCAAAVAGAIGAGAGGGHPAGTVVSIGIGLTVALFVVFLDDLAALFSASGDPGPGLSPGGNPR